MKKEKTMKNKINGVNIQLASAALNEGTIVVTNSLTHGDVSISQNLYFNKCMVCGKWHSDLIAKSKYLCSECEMMLRDRFVLNDLTNKPKRTKRTTDYANKKRIVGEDYVQGEDVKTKFIKFIEKEPAKIKILDFDKRDTKPLSRARAEKLFELVAMGCDTKAELCAKTGLKLWSVVKYMFLMNKAKLVYFSKKEQKYFTYSNVPIKRVG